MGLAREGRIFVWPALAVTAGAWVVAILAASAWAYGVAGLVTVVTAFLLYFFRDPERTPPPGEDVAVAPGDGRIVEITEVDEPSFLGGRCRRISIFLSIFNVHVQRAPLSGTVGHRSARGGGFGVAWSSEASEGNAQASVGIEARGGRILVRQIVGLVARRIVTYPGEGDALQRGERIGIILFGSRVDLFVPLSWTVLCEVGDVARGGLTPMARVETSAGEAT